MFKTLNIYFNYKYVYSDSVCISIVKVYNANTHINYKV